MSSIAPALNQSGLLQQLGQLLLQPLFVQGLPIIQAAFAQGEATPGLASDPVALALIGNKLVADLGGILPSIKNTDLSALLQISEAVITAIAGKLAGSPVTAAGVAGQIAASITGAGQQNSQQAAQ